MITPPNGGTTPQHAADPKTTGSFHLHSHQLYCIGFHQELPVELQAVLQTDNQSRSTIMSETQTFSSIPILPLSQALDPTTKPKFLDDLRSALLNVGFLYLSETGLPSQLVKDVISECQAFFQKLPLEEKERIEMKNEKSFLGWSRVSSSILCFTGLRRWWVDALETKSALRGLSGQGCGSQGRAALETTHTYNQTALYKLIIIHSLILFVSSPRRQTFANRCSGRQRNNSFQSRSPRTT